MQNAAVTQAGITNEIRGVGAAFGGGQPGIMTSEMIYRPKDAPPEFSSAEEWKVHAKKLQEDFDSSEDDL